MYLYSTAQIKITRLLDTFNCIHIISKGGNIAKRIFACKLTVNSICTVYFYKNFKIGGCHLTY